MIPTNHGMKLSPCTLRGLHDALKWPFANLKDPPTTTHCTCTYVVGLWFSMLSQIFTSHHLIHAFIQSVKIYTMKVSRIVINSMAFLNQAKYKELSDSPGLWEREPKANEICCKSFWVGLRRVGQARVIGRAWPTLPRPLSWRRSRVFLSLCLFYKSFLYMTVEVLTTLL